MQTMSTGLEALREWRAHWVPTQGAISADYQAIEGVGAYHVGLDFATGGWYWCNAEHFAVTVNAREIVYGQRGEAAVQRVALEPGADCAIEGSFPVLGVLDLLERPRVVEAVSVSPDGVLTVTALFPSGSRCLTPASADAKPAKWTYVLGPKGRVQSLEFEKGGAVERVDYTYREADSTPVGVAELTHGGSSRLTTAEWFPRAPDGFLSVERIRSLSDRTKVWIEDRLTAGRAAEAPPTGTPAVSTEVPRPYNPFAGYGAPVVCVGVILCLLAAYAWWRQRR